jgi:oligosaccharide repeat unit polymerase
MFKANGRPYSLNKIFYIFCFFFLGLAPAMQYKFDVSFHGGPDFTSNAYLILNIIFIITIIIYDLSYKYFLTEPIKTIKGFKLKDRNPLKRDQAIIILYAVSAVSFLVVLYNFNFNILALFVRSGIEYNAQLASSGPISLIIKIFVRPLPVISLIVYRSLYKKVGLYDVIFLLLILLSNAPTGMARFQAAALYLPLLIVYIKPIKKNINFSLSICVGLVTIFPMLNVFRHFVALKYSNPFNHNIFLGGGFDSYYNFLLVINHKIITWGHQLLGVLFFFIPSSLWNNKPIGSGAFVAHKLNLTFSNIAMNFFGEGYINFGYLGIFLFCIILAYMNGRLDRKYWKKNNNDSFLIWIAYLFLLGMEFFILRGDLLSSFAYTVGLMLAIVLIYRLVTKKAHGPKFANY